MAGHLRRFGDGLCREASHGCARMRTASSGAPSPLTFIGRGQVWEWSAPAKGHANGREAVSRALSLSTAETSTWRSALELRARISVGLPQTVPKAEGENRWASSQK